MASDNNVKAAIIIVNWNGKDYLKPCLESLRHTKLKNTVYSVILVDNASTDGSIEEISLLFPEISIIKLDNNYGFAAGCNRGIECALEWGTEYVVLLNPDTIVDPGWLQPLVDLMEADLEIGAAQSLILLHDAPDCINTDGNPIHIFGFGYSGNYGRSVHEIGINLSISREIPSPSGASVILRAKVIKQVGMLDQDLFLYVEDLDLGWRLHLAGYKVVLEPKSRVYHRYSGNLISKKLYYIERNRLIVIIKNYHLATLLMILPLLLSFEIFMLLYSIKNRWLKLKIKGYIDFLELLPQTLEKRRKIQGVRKLKEKELLPYFTTCLNYDKLNGKTSRLGSSLLSIYWNLVSRVIFW